MPTPYIGITGFVFPRESAAVLDIAPANSSRLVMIGVLASSRTLRGLSNRWPNRYPAVSNIAAILPDHPLALNLVHYNTEEPGTLSEQLLELTGLGGPNLHGFQLNIAWPPIAELHQHRERFPQMKLVLQISQQSLQMVNSSTRQVVDKLAQEYAGLVDYLLLDLSAGAGIPLDPAWSAECLTALQEVDPGVGLGIAGGLSPATLDLIAPLIKDFPDLSIDAESLLRDEDDNLDIGLARDYIGRALELLARPG